MATELLQTLVKIAKQYHLNTNRALRIVIDGRPAFENLAGIGRYTRDLLSAIEASTIDCEFYILIKAVNPNVPLKPEMLKKCIPFFSPLRGFQWHFVALLDPIGRPFDLYYSPSSLIVPAFAKFPTSVTIHDLSVLRVPETQSKKTLFIERLLLPRAVRKSSNIIVPSQSTKSDILEYFPKTDEKRITVILEKPAQEFLPKSANDPLMTSTLRTYNLQEKYYFLSVGTIEPRKNYPTLLKAYAKYRELGGKKKLLIVGKKGWKYGETFATLENLRINDSAQIIETVSFAELPYLYSAAACTLCISLYEGYGLPAAEALACGSKVIASNTSSLPEVVGDKGMLVDPRDIEGIAKAMIQKTYS